MEEGIRNCTTNPAYASHEDGVAFGPAAEVRVLYTVFDGRLVHEEAAPRIL